MPLSEEYRVFIYAGQIMMIDDYWHKDGNVKLSDTEKLWLESMASKVKSNFISMMCVVVFRTLYQCRNW